MIRGRPNEATHLYMGVYYKKGLHNYIFWWNGYEWVRDPKRTHIPGSRLVDIDHMSRHGHYDRHRTSHNGDF